MKKILAGIDGTGSAFTPGAKRDKAYDKNFADSFVNRIAQQNPNPDFGYWRGPVALGGGLVPAINGAFTFLDKKVKSNRGGVEILLTGYSRGAAGVVSLAKKLKDAGYEVRAMILFDCVDRHLFIDAATVPDNVKNVLHLMRDPKAGSRESFSNDATHYYPNKTKMEAYTFFCTHGGVGGCPWKVPTGKKLTDKIVESAPDGKTNVTYSQDQSAAKTVWKYIQPFGRKHGFF